MNNTYPTLYSRDLKGTIIKWNIEVQNNNSSVDIKTSYGELEGKQTLSWKRNIQGKNIGKVNETTPFEQACNEAESTIKRKKDNGYMSYEEVKTEFNIIIPVSLHHDLELFLPKIKTDALGATKPMKCQQYYRSKKDWVAPDGSIWEDRKYYYLANPYVKKSKDAIITKFPCIGQPKINGVRATIQLIDGKTKILSKEGKEYIIPQLLDYFNANLSFFKNGTIVFDGELYIHGELLQDIASAVKKVSLMTQRVIFVLFDLAIPDILQMSRWEMVKEYRNNFNQNINCPIQVIRTFNINNDNDAQVFTDKCIDEGYEGAIFRNLNNKYAFGGRPTTITKLKRTISREFKIINIVAEEVDPTLGMYECITKEGKAFTVTAKGTKSFKKELLFTPLSYIGKNLSVTFYEWTKDMIPFHIVDNSIRDYE